MLGGGYGKIFKQIYAGTLRSNWKALITFEQLIVLCDQHGVIDMPHEVLHNITGIPTDIIRDGIAALESTDPRSRSPKEDGRRIIRLDVHRDWGWQIVNHQYYRDIVSREEKLEADRKRIADRRAEEKLNKINNVAECSVESQPSRLSHTQTQPQTHTHTHTQLTTLASSEKISLSAATGNWVNISPVILQKWVEAYPALNIQTELAKAAVWILANPKNKKSNYARFLTNWLARSQDSAPRADKPTTGKIGRAVEACKKAYAT